MNCRICRSETRSIGRALVLGKHRVEYFACETCGFVQTEEPHWLAEAYTEAITSQDIGLVGRNVQFAGLMRQVLPVFFDHHAQFVDYGGGYGMFVRLMRDYGFDFFRYDTYCQNIFAKGFEARDGNKAELVTAFEVFEHLPDPLKTIEHMLSFAPSILFSELLVSEPPPALGDWWYYAPEHGQHVAFYSLRTLRHIADHFDLNLVTDGRQFHILTPKKISQTMFRLMLGRVGQLLSIAYKRRLHRRSYLARDTKYEAHDEHHETNHLAKTQVVANESQEAYGATENEGRQAEICQARR